MNPKHSQSHVPLMIMVQYSKMAVHGNSGLASQIKRLEKRKSRNQILLSVPNRMNLIAKLGNNVSMLNVQNVKNEFLKYQKKENIDRS